LQKDNHSAWGVEMDFHILIGNGWEFGAQFSVRKPAVSPCRLFDTVVSLFLHLDFLFPSPVSHSRFPNSPFPVLVLLIFLEGKDGRWMGI